jgi:A/G-specific adenine glycosylase
MQITNEKILNFQTQMLIWYKDNGRHFPWRNKSATTYQQIISEVLLQRTRAATVVKFFPKFIKKYQSWSQLGKASEQELQEFIKPLGLYNQRGTRLYKLAQELKIRKGRFPKNRNEVEEIPMMGQYITNAFEIFILKRPSPLLDVNMARVLERYFGPRQKSDIRYDPYLQVLSKKIVNHSNFKEINWAILDFGAKTCISKKPKCSICTLSENCLSYTKS